MEKRALAHRRWKINEFLQNSNQPNQIIIYLCLRRVQMRFNHSIFFCGFSCILELVRLTWQRVFIVFYTHTQRHLNRSIVVVVVDTEHECVGRGGSTIERWYVYIFKYIIERINSRRRRRLSLYILQRMSVCEGCVWQVWCSEFRSCGSSMVYRVSCSVCVCVCDLITT